MEGEMCGKDRDPGYKSPSEHLKFAFFLGVEQIRVFELSVAFTELSPPALPPSPPCTQNLEDFAQTTYVQDPTEN